MTKVRGILKKGALLFYRKGKGFRWFPKPDDNRHIMRPFAPVAVSGSRPAPG